MPANKIIWCLLGVFLLHSPGLFARSAWYEIEVIIFAHASNRALQTEFWERNPGGPLKENARLLVNMSTFRSMAGNNDHMLVKLSQSQLNLRDINNKLQRGGDYQPLYHAAWRELVSPRNQAQPIYIRSSQTLPPPTQPMPFQMQAPAGNQQMNQGQPMAGGQQQMPPGQQPGQPGPRMNQAPIPILEGTINISLGKYLHANFDLVYTMRNPDYQPGAMMDTATPQGPEVTSEILGESADSAETVEMAPPPPPPQYIKLRMQQHRRMRSKQLHYVDHPKIGIFIQALPYNAGKQPSGNSGGGGNVQPLRR